MAHACAASIDDDDGGGAAAKTNNTPDILDISTRLRSRNCLLASARMRVFKEKRRLGEG
jgi:hypothetical protein